MPPRKKRTPRSEPLPATPADAPRRKGNFPLAYTPHPETNRYPTLFPEHLADASKREHEIRFEHLVELHDVLTEIEQLLVWLNPRCVLFFATGGYPIVFPLLERLRHAEQCQLLSGRVFHMFPGLSWEGSIDGLRPEPYFARELEPILRTPSPTGGNAIVAIDTTNSGNAVNLAVKAIQAACEQAGLSDPEIVVLGIVNGDKAMKEDDGSRVLLRSTSDPDQGAYILIPSDFTPAGGVASGRLTEFGSISGTLPSIRIGYWRVGKIFTEDVLDLIGAAAIREKLGVKCAGGAGRLVIRYNEKVANRGMGYGSVASQVLGLLSAPRDSGRWALLERNYEYAQDPVEDEEFREAADDSIDIAFTILELGRNPAASIEHIADRKSGLPSGNRIRWLADHLPEAVKATPKVLAAIRKADADDWTVKAALFYLRRAYPDMAAGEPADLSDEDARQWWVARPGELKPN